MAKSAVNQLTVTVRTETGKGASRRARRDGKIPAVLYGHGAAPQHLELPGHDFAAVLRHSGGCHICHMSRWCRRCSFCPSSDKIRLSPSGTRCGGCDVSAS